MESEIIFKYYFRQINLLKIFIFILIGLLIIMGVFMDVPWKDRILIFGILVILIVLRKQYLIGDHMHLYKIEMAKKIKDKLEIIKQKENEGNLSKKIEDELIKEGETTTSKE